MGQHHLNRPNQSFPLGSIHPLPTRTSHHFLPLNRTPLDKLQNITNLLQSSSEASKRLEILNKQICDKPSVGNLKFSFSSVSNEILASAAELAAKLYPER